MFRSCSGGTLLDVVGKLPGRSQMQTTLRQTHLMDSPLRAGVDVVAPAFRPKPRRVHDAKDPTIGQGSRKST